MQDQSERATAVGAGVPTRAPAGGKYFTMGALTVGHSIKHWYQQGFWVLLPHIKQAMELSPIQAGLIITVRQVVSGVADIPTGVAADIIQRRVVLILGAALTALGVGFLLVGLAPAYGVVLVAVGLTGLAPGLWHPPAVGILSRTYPTQRGLALSLHRMGGSLGDSVAPIVVGAMLGFLMWRHVFLVQVVPALLLAVLLVWTLRGLTARSVRRIAVGAYLQGARGLLTNRVVLATALLGGMRALGHTALLTFLVLYLKETLKFSDVSVGFHISLLTLLGVGASPGMGLLSDRIGRRPVIVVGFMAIGLLVLALIWAGAGWTLTLVLAALGIFLYSMQPIIMASGMDAIGSGTEATAAGLLFATSTAFSASSPVIAGWLVQEFGIRAAFLYVGSIMLAAAVLSMVMPLRNREAAPETTTGLPR